MNRFTWQQKRLIDRVRWLRFILPPILVLVVIFYQLGIAQALENSFGHAAHYGVEVAFYSLTGPVLTWLMLVWVERKLSEQEQLEKQIKAAEREKASVLEEERARIARDLHDGMAQTLYFLALKTDILRQKLRNEDKAAQDLLEMGMSLRQIIQGIRRTIFALRSLEWSKEGFSPALTRFVDDFAEQLSWHPTMLMDQNLDIPQRLEPTIFRLVQESLNNAAKHAQATEISVSLKKRGDCLQLMVRDNGLGFDTDGRYGRGFGLSQMADRVSAVGGTLKIDSQAGNGTTVVSQLPLTGTDNG